MPGRTDFDIETNVYRRPSDIPRTVWRQLHSDPLNANILLPCLVKASNYERRGGRMSKDTLWIACFSKTDHSALPDEQGRVLDFFVSCTDGPIDKYPIFIYSSHPREHLHDTFLLPRMARIASELQRNVAPERTFSVFALKPAAEVFSEVWTQQTGIAVEEQPYYAATFSYCTRETFVQRKASMFPGEVWDLRMAALSDLDAVASLCHGFAEGSEPFVLTRERAFEEASLLIDQGQVWVHEVKRNGQPSAIASIVAVTRETASVSAITKVYTNPDFRRRGFAERLVRKVTQELLQSGKEFVVLYVAHDNKAAAKVYHRVGFAGLASDANEVTPGVEPWLELGFDQSVVRLGHW
ncbi:hypothetical protein BD410DRAFT_781986 [Rickenella mellea]|uniref:N-acetyltransferase domain-containing protein n=1 Tax=Rickenella mellea TaxID=50990 RepID=A0A4Y7QM94_9AGAM|nr:hypothetical protein BD410DRAFT_781986 [Rickenella mellea]